MWSMFFLSFVVAGAFLYAPGFALFKGLGFRAAPSLCLAPAASLITYCLLGIAWERLGVWASWHTLLPAALAVCVILGAVAALARRRSSGDLASRAAEGGLCDGIDQLTIKALVPFVLMGIFVGVYAFVLPLDGPDSFAQNWDNAFHLNATAQFLRTGNYSMFSMGAWLPGETAPVADAVGYYPSSWSVIVGLVASATGVSVPCAMNATNFAFLSLVYPTSMCLLAHVLFGGDQMLCRSSAIVTPLFVAFPWIFVEFGSLNPNLCGLSLTPLIVGSFVLLGYQLLEGRSWLASALGFAIALVSGAVAHPNAVFSAAVVLAPFCVWLAVRLAEKAWPDSLGRTLRSRLVAIATSCVLALLWVGLACLPPLRNVVTNAWNYDLDPFQALTNLVTLGFLRDYGQPLLALLVIAGIMALLRTGRAAWIAASLVFASFIFLVNVILCSGFGEYTLKAIVAGFWYQDPYRTAATVVLPCVPLAAAGLARVMGLARRRVDSMRAGWQGNVCILSFLRGHAAGIAAALVVLAILWPSFRLPGVTDVVTGFGGFRDDMANSFDTSSNVLDGEERRFLERIRRVVPEGALIVNLPDDGSVFASGLYGLNTYYRVFGVQWKSDETEQSKLLRESAAELANDSEARAAFSSIGARYLLILDSIDEESDTRRFVNSFHPELWQGIMDVNEDTPGLRLVLSEGDMRLYRVLD